MSRGARVWSGVLNRTLIGAALIAATLAWPGAAPTLARTGVLPAALGEDTLQNPPIADSCGTNVTLVLDASGSIQSSNAVDDVRNAADAFLDALADTGSTARVLQFASLSEQLAPQAEVTSASLQNGGVFRTALNRYYNPKPPRRSAVDIHSYRGSGSITSTTSWTLSNSSNQYTNWDQSLDQAGTAVPGDEPIELVVYVTDGDPTSYDFNQAGDPFDPGPPDVGVNTDRGQANATTLDRAVEEANQIKAAGTRMLAVGVGSALGNAASRNRLAQIAGPKIADDRDFNGPSPPESINDVDVALVTDFEDLAQFLRSVVNQLCSPSLSIRKLAQSADTADYLPAAGWEITVTPTVAANGTFRWILPDSDDGQRIDCYAGSPPGTPPLALGSENDQAPRTCRTNGTGLSNFQWEPGPETASTSAVVQETVQPGFTPGRPGLLSDWRCALKNEDGTEETLEGALLEIDGRPGFELDVDPQQIITCNIYNSFDYDPQLDLTKVDDPIEVRGDLDPPVEVTSTFSVTNPGNTPITNVAVVDDECGTASAVEVGGFNVGDTNQNGQLDPAPSTDSDEVWQFGCARPITSPASTDPAGRVVTNTAVASGNDPRGVSVESPEAFDTIAAFNPAISVEKLVRELPQGIAGSSIVVPSGSNVLYTYRVLNTGNTPLAPYGTPAPDPLTFPSDDTCAPLVRGADEGDGNDDAVLDVGEVWTYSCQSVDVTSSVTNTVTVDATPLKPSDALPFPGPNPRVSDVDTAQVDVVNPAIELTKTASPTLLLLDEAGTPETATYTFVAVNTGDVRLARPSSFVDGGAGATGPGWIVDTRCGPVTFLDDDAGPITPGNGDNLIDPGEGWRFTCEGEVDQPTVNRADITAQPVDADTGTATGGVVTDVAFAVVDVLQPGVDITKTALRSVVVDPDATPVSGPDTPAPRPAGYRYEIVNTGNVPLGIDDSTGISDDTCDTLERGTDEPGDNDNLLEVGEVWVYTCEQQLQRVPPPGPDDRLSGIIVNTVEVIGVPFFENAPVPDKSVRAEDDASVLVIEPRLILTKTASARVVLAGGDVTYTFVVTNNGDVGLDVVGLTDDKCSPLTFVGGDDSGGRPPNGILDGANSGDAESWTYSCTRSLDLPEAPAVSDVNTARVLALDPLGNLYEETATATVRVFDPAVELVKSARERLVPVGTPVTYDFVVSNVGTSPLSADDVLAQITLDDVGVPAIPECDSPSPVDIDQNTNGLLDKDEVWLYECTATINADTVNVALVTGVGGTQFDPPLPVNVFDVSAAFVGVFDPAIEVTKTASPTEVLESGDVTYRYEVRNTGDVPLADVKTRIVDDKCAPVTYVSGDLDDDGLLDTPTSIFEDAADEVWIFTCTARITTDTTNVVTVTGTPTDPDGSLLCGNEPVGPAAALLERCDVTDTATTNVTVERRGSITIVKDADPNGTTPFQFGGTLGSFQLVDDGGTQNSRTFAGLARGTFTVTESAATGWTLDSITCVDPTNDSAVSLLAGTATIALGPSESVTCTFRNTGAAVLPPLPPQPELPATGSATGIPALLTGLALLGFGLVLKRASRRRHLA